MSTPHQILINLSNQVPYNQWQFLQDAVYKIALSSSFEHLPTRKTSYIQGWQLTISSQDTGRVEYVYEENGSVTKLSIILQSIFAVRSDGCWTSFDKEIELEHCNYLPPLDTKQNMPTLDLGVEQAVFVPTSVEELGTPLELAEQDEQDVDEEKPVSPASESCLNMAPPKFGGAQADSVLSSVKQLGTLSTQKKMPTSDTSSFEKCIAWPPKSGGIYMSFSRDEEPDAWYTTMLNHAQLIFGALPNPA